jgi:hypothetical protein
MASIYKKPSHTIFDKIWNEKNLPKETNKLQNKDLRYKLKAEAQINNGKLGVVHCGQNHPRFQQGGRENPSRLGSLL